MDPEVLLKEISDLKSKGFNPDLSLSDRAHITLSYHLLLDAAEEEFKGSLRSGTTMRGIGPTYTDKAGDMESEPRTYWTLKYSNRRSLKMRY